LYLHKASKNNGKNGLTSWIVLNAPSPALNATWIKAGWYPSSINIGTNTGDNNAHIAEPLAINSPIN
jgi:hypothetical protein